MKEREEEEEEIAPEVEIITAEVSFGSGFNDASLPPSRFSAESGDVGESVIEAIAAHGTGFGDAGLPSAVADDVDEGGVGIVGEVEQERSEVDAVSSIDA